MFLHIIDRETARSIGLKNFFNTKPCRPFGNVTIRSVTTGRCLCEQHRKKHADKQRLRAKTHPAAYEEKKRKVREWVKNNPEKSKQSRIDHRTKIKSMGLKRKSSEKQSIYAKKYRERNKEKIAALQSTRRVKIRHPLSIPKEITELDIFVLEQCYDLKYMREEQTGIFWNLDHMQPLGGETRGMHTWDNFQVIPYFLNVLKRHRPLFTKPHQWFNYA